MVFSESTLRQYAAPLSETENEKCKHTISAIRDSLKGIGYTDNNKDISLLESDTLSYSISMRNVNTNAKIHIFIQGSYANNTCVRNESDVDIAVMREDMSEYSFGATFSTSSTDQAIEAEKLKAAVLGALNKSFPYQVKRANKSIKVAGNTYRKKSDVVPCISMKYFHQFHNNDWLSYQEGVVIFTDDGEIIRNFPKQHIANGRRKNSFTNTYYKKMVRIIKKIRSIMEDSGYACAKNVSSFGLESLLWNIPDPVFTRWTGNYGMTFDGIVNYLYKNKLDLPTYLEANGIKKLCPTQADVNNYRSFIDALYCSYSFSD